MRKIVFISLLMVMAISLSAGEIFHVPKVNSANDRSGSMAVNRLGDTLVIYRNGTDGIMWYLKKSGSTTWIGPNAVPNQPLNFLANINNTSTVATPDGKFHVAWDGWGVHYAIFDPESQTWTNPDRTIVGVTEAPSLKVNPVNGDVCLVFVWFIWGSKDIYFKNMTTGVTYQVSRAMYSETNPEMNFDAEGYLYITYKEDRVPFTGVDEFIILLQVYDKDCNHVWGDVLTWYYYGWRFLPTVSVVKNKGIVAWAYSSGMHYQYLDIERSGSTILFDENGVKDFAPCPALPWFSFFSFSVPHGNKIYYYYRSQTHELYMKRYQEGEWLDDSPVIVSQGMGIQWPFKISSSPQGVWAIWHTGDDPSEVYFTLYEDQLVMSAVNVQHQHVLGGPVFLRYYVNVVTWEDNPFNVESNIKVVKYRIYRKVKTDPGFNYTYVGEVGEGVYQFAEKNVPAEDNYEYKVTCVDDSGNESQIG